MSIFDQPLISIGIQADKIRRNLWGKDTFYVKNLHINYTNICLNRCKFCVFSRRTGDPDGYLMSSEDILNNVRIHGKETKELHIVGGLHPDIKLDYYTEMLSALKSEFPDKALKAFSAVEAEFMARQSGLPPEKLFSRLKAAGLDSMPGGGAEIFDEKVRNIICPEKISGAKWLEIMETAHDSGIKTNATMLYGHFESSMDRENHLLLIRKLQERTGGFNAFIPLAFQPYGTVFDSNSPATAVDDLYVTAAARIILDNVPHIKAYWVMMGEKTAQIALHFGADDLDGTIVQENIAYAAGAKSKRGMTETELRHLITTAGLNPVERDSFYIKVA
ncbi:MAG: CofH family radical SAM protein [Deferribacteraceae bacterium]|jgi:aminodeoxyfutalosine synthase|nr:CofH family radical SAM protein [Deferribacteraceae bacterium]